MIKCYVGAVAGGFLAPPLVYIIAYLIGGSDAHQNGLFIVGVSGCLGVIAGTLIAKVDDSDNSSPMV